MDLHEQLKPLDAEAKRTGVPCLPEWFERVFVSRLGDMVGVVFASDAGRFESYGGLGNGVKLAAARMIAEAGMARMLRARGVGVVLLDTVWYTWKNEYVGLSPLDATDDLSALIAAMLKVYNTLPDAAKGWE